MPVLQVIASQPLAGKSAIAAGLVRGFAEQGVRVRLLRAGSSAAAAEDATSFARLTFATSPGTPVSAFGPTDAPAAELTIIETEAGSVVDVGLAGLLVVRGAATEADRALAATLGDRLAGTIATRVPAAEVEAVARDLTNSGLRPLALLPEDRTLAAPSVDEIRSTLAAQLLHDGDNGADVVEDVLIAPVYADPARPHFRRFASKAILAPYNKTDLLLAAIESQASCLVITGGARPSPYVADRASGEETTVMLAPEETPQTVTALAEVWFSSRFRGERKAAAAHALLRGRLDFASLQRKLS